MARNASGKFVSSAPAAPSAVVESDDTPQWTNEELLRVRHLGPGIIGQAMYDAAQRLVSTTHEGLLGPAITTHDDPAFYQGADRAKRFGLAEVA